MNPFVSFLGCEPFGSAIHTLAFADVWSLGRLQLAADVGQVALRRRGGLRASAASAAARGRCHQQRHGPEHPDPALRQPGRGSYSRLRLAGRNRRFRRSSWTCARPPFPCSIRSSRSCSPTSASPRSPTRCRRPPASPSRRCRCCWRRCTSSSAARSSCCCPRTPTPGTRPKERAGSSARSASRCCRAAACTGARGSSRRRISSASGRGRSTCSQRAVSSAPRRQRSPSRCRRRRPGLRRSGSRPARRPGSRRSPSCWRSRGTSASTASRSAATSPSAAG